MPAGRGASSREAPSSTSARASIRREAAPSRHRLASRRRSPAPSSCRVIPTVMAPPLIGYTADQPRQAPRGSERDDVSAIRAVGITLKRHHLDAPVEDFLLLFGRERDRVLVTVGVHPDLAAGGGHRLICSGK